MEERLFNIDMLLLTDISHAIVITRSLTWALQEQ